MHLSTIKVSYQRIESGLRVWLMHAVRYAGCLRASLFKLFSSEPLRLWPWRSHESAVTGSGKHLYKSTCGQWLKCPQQLKHIYQSLSVCHRGCHTSYSLYLCLCPPLLVSFSFISLLNFDLSMDWYATLSSSRYCISSPPCAWTCSPLYLHIILHNYSAFPKPLL